MLNYIKMHKFPMKFQFDLISFVLFMVKPNRGNNFC